ncbi:hypothetical protein Rsub_09558 [Raphidocelis subcapitata]|uniref:Glutaredoxin domain-containing protein n=1 Tax=Raphidocelis subcapitata TaxID=307507 RepID=A0A2V0PHJ4_9CHLO|nr:hypothetical protein Rsub_09558 [Raphidocelis subcapitata]|eukprot:GBF97393.1 hypothetical protein Rsub_09558 [Raphidocelis subcapitata]
MQLARIHRAAPVGAPARRAAAARSPTTTAPAPQRRSIVAAGFLEEAINAVTIAVKESPLNKGKKALAKLQAGDYDEAAVRAKLEGILTGTPVVMFSFSTCPFCNRAKALLNELGASYEAIELNEMGKDGMQLRAELAQMTDRTSMPSIWIQGSFVGGCNDGPGIMPLHKQGKLVPLLREAGALR